MERLTDKELNYISLYQRSCDDNRERGRARWYEIAERLRHIENLEEQIGCPLEEYVAIKENGIYIKEEPDEFGIREIAHIEPCDIDIYPKDDKIVIWWEESSHLRDENIFKELKYSDKDKTWWIENPRKE
jgi:hypothetical protein